MHPPVVHDSFNPIQAGGGGYRFFSCCAETACSTLMKLSDFQDSHGNSFVKSGSLGKNDQNQQTWLKIKTAAIFD